MGKRKHSYYGTIIAVVVIIVLILLSKFVFKEDFERKDVLVEPTESATFPYFEGTVLTQIPTE